MYTFVVTIARLLVRLVWGLNVQGLEHIPRDTGAIIAGNHTSWFDPVVIAAAIKRRCSWEKRNCSKPCSSLVFSHLVPSPRNGTS